MVLAFRLFQSVKSERWVASKKHRLSFIGDLNKGHKCFRFLSYNPFTPSIFLYRVYN